MPRLVPPSLRSSHALARVAMLLACAAAASGCNLFSTTDDRRAPAVTLLAPDTTVADVAGDVVIRISAEARGTDNTIQSAEIVVGGHSVGTALPVASATAAPVLGQPAAVVSRVRTFTYTLDTRTLTDGEYRVEAVAFDGHGARGTSRSVRLRVRNGDGSGPLVRIVSPLEGDSVRGKVTVVARPDFGQPTPSQVEFFVDGLVRAIFTAAPYEWTWNTGADGSGPHRLQVRASLGPGTRLSPIVNVIVRDTVVKSTDPTFGPTCTTARCTRFRVSGLIGAPVGIAQSLGGVLYVTTTTGALYGLNKDGQVLSLFQVGEAPGGPPLITNGDNVVVTGRSGKLHAFAPNGNRLWPAYDAGSPIVSGASVGPTGNFFFGDGKGRIHGVSVSTGAALAGFPVQLPMTNPITPSVAIDRDGNIYAIAGDGRVYSIAADGRLRWTSADNLGVGLHPPALSERTEGALRITTVYVITMDGRLVAVSGATGATDWSQALPGRALSGPLGSSPVIGGDGTIYAATAAGLAAFNEVIPAGGTRQRYVLTLPDLNWPTLDAAGNLHLVSGTDLLTIGSSGTVAARTLLGGRVETPLVLTREGILVAHRTDGLVQGFLIGQKLAAEKWPTYGRSNRHTFRIGIDAGD